MKTGKGNAVRPIQIGQDISNQDLHTNESRHQSCNESRTESRIEKKNDGVNKSGAQGLTKKKYIKLTPAKRTPTNKTPINETQAVEALSKKMRAPEPDWQDGHRDSRQDDQDDNAFYRKGYD